MHFGHLKIETDYDANITDPAFGVRRIGDHLLCPPAFVQLLTTIDRDDYVSLVEFLDFIEENPRDLQTAFNAIGAFDIRNVIENITKLRPLMESPSNPFIQPCFDCGGRGDHGPYQGYCDHCGGSGEGLSHIGVQLFAIFERRLSRDD